MNLAPVLVGHATAYIDEGQPFVVVRQAVALAGGRANKEETMFRSGLVKSACVAILISGFSAPYRGGYGYRGYGYHGGYGYRPYGYGAAAAIGAAAVGAAVVAPHCWINPYGVRVCN
jgi:hypothetical protein